MTGKRTLSPDEYREFCALARKAEELARDFAYSRNGVTADQMVQAQSALREWVGARVDWSAATVAS